ncbi:hypothetical protein WA026_016371 [Henosepilachna vigintioctopunctata]|uniref:CBM21 domain-containing protein n=1 Tax=Henosepilachna vigintioctopunctata TaxID=420089 RepID=A0AAW1UCX6_9CUCU
MKTFIYKYTRIIKDKVLKRTAMTENNRYGLVSSMLPVRTDNFARNLHDRFRALGIGDKDENSPVWYQNGNGQTLHPFSSAPLSPEDERGPYDFSNNHIESNGLDQNSDSEYNYLTDIVPRSDPISHCNENGSDGNRDYSSPVFGSPLNNFLGSASSIDELYETASDHSADGDDDITLLARNVRESTPPPSIIENDSDEPPALSVTSNGEDDKNSSNGSSIEIDFNFSDRNEDDSFAEGNRPQVRRCSSLKSGKTPPGTPRRAKIVRFADMMGLDLASVKTFVDEIPRVPISAFHDLTNCEDEPPQSVSNRITTNNSQQKLVLPLFHQPGGQSDFLDIVRKNFVCLENAVLEDNVLFAIKGIVRVRNIDFHKSVFVRYSKDSWRTFVDANATYIENSCDGFSDKFSFLIYANSLTPGQTLEFAVVFQARGEQFWDNNKGSNYSFQCIWSQAPSVTPSTYSSSWQDDCGASFY